jgi:ankyrin repeat protein
MRLEAWEFLTKSWDRAESERARLEKATLIFFEDIERDDWAAVARLIERGCSPNMALGHKTAAMVAAECAAINALRLLVSTGANLGAQDEQGRDALFFAIGTRADEAVDFLLESGSRLKRLFNDNSTALIEAAKGSYVHGVRALVAHEKKWVNLYDRMGRTALWHVLSKEHLTDADNEIARILMGAGANPDMADIDGVTAREASTSEVAQSLVERHDIEASVEPDGPQVDPGPEADAPAPSRPRPRL